MVYPSGLFSLEKDEVYPCERFAYSLLDIAVEVLHHAQLPENIVVDFTQIIPGISPWSLNASVNIDSDGSGNPIRFRFMTPELFPAITYLFTAELMRDIFTEGGPLFYEQNPNALRERTRRFAEGTSAGVRAFQSGGVAAGVRAAYDHLGLTVTDLERCANDYDLLTKLIAYHEVGHAYTQLAVRTVTSPLESSALELIADLLATQWFYQKIIVNTPDTEEYRRFRGVSSYAEAIFSNALISLQSQQALLIFMAIAGAQINAGKVSLSGGPTHPPGLQRYSLQHLAILTLILSNFSKVLSEEHVTRLDNDWHSRMAALVRSGMIPLPDLEGLLNASECDTIEIAADLIERFAIEDLRPMIPLLKDIRRQMTESLNRKRGRKL